MHRTSDVTARALILSISVVLCLWGAACSKESHADSLIAAGKVESCMFCHNGSDHDDYAGSGLENPHPFAGAGTLRCTQCHGGNPRSPDMVGSHVPPPPEIGDEENLRTNRQAYFNRLTLAGIDKFTDYEVGGVTYTALQYLQFINPGDLRVVTKGESCGECHAGHAECVAKSPLATEVGILSSSMYTLGVESSIPEYDGLYNHTSSDLAFRSVTDDSYVSDPTRVGSVPRLDEFPVFSRFGDEGDDAIFRNPAYNALDLADGLRADNSVIAGSPLANLFHEQVAFTCGDCHLGSAGANNRYGDFRSSGCTACHMRYALDGRSKSTDPNIRKNEPLDPDDIDEPERPHVDRHMIASVARTLASGETVEGIDDHTCAGCHQGSNRTVMQFWGIRLDQNQDVRRRNQYPANPDPDTVQNTARDTRLFDPEVRNRTFNGRNANQYIAFEDYDADGRDDTPPDVHHEAGLGCIDCHGSHDLHGGVVGNPDANALYSRQEQAVAIRCESCHGDVDAYAETTSGTTYEGEIADVAVDAEGNPLRHVTREGDEYFLVSRLTGRRHYIPQTRDTVVDSGKRHPFTGEVVYSQLASYAMGRADGLDSTGIGPMQTGSAPSGFSHGDNMSCISCHASWTNTCIGCHLGGEYDTGNNFSNITGERIVFRQANADFVYQSPVPFQLGVDTHDKIAPISPNTEAFFQYEDLDNNRSQVFAFSDRHGTGNNPAGGGNAHPALSHNVIMPHSIRGKVAADKEGPRYCVACHLTEDSVTNFGAEYDAFRASMAARDYGSLDFELLRAHIGQNPGNQADSPLWVHMVAGLGSGLFLFDENGCPVNPLDENAERIGCNGISPAERFDPVNVRFDLDRIVEESGISNGSNNHTFLEAGHVSDLRDGALHPERSGPLGARLIRRLADPATGVVLDSWVDADGELHGGAATFVPSP